MPSQRELQDKEGDAKSWTENGHDIKETKTSQREEKLRHISQRCLRFIMQRVQTEQALSSMTIVLRGKL